MIYNGRSDWSRTVRYYIQYTRTDDVIESYARSDWLKYFDEYYIKQINPIIHGCVL